MLALELQSLIEGQVREPLFLVDVEMSGDGKSRILRVVVDTDAGVTVEQLGALNREIGRRLDEEDRITGHYRLEVCSPGLDRPLRHPRVLARALGRNVKFRVEQPGAEPPLPAEGSGRLVASDDEGIEVEMDGATLRLAWSRLRSVHHVLEW